MRQKKVLEKLKNKAQGRHWKEGVCFLLSGLLVVFMMVLIFYFSAQNAVRSSGVSGGMSQWLVEKISGIFALPLKENQIVFWGEILEMPLRKGAHFTEYMVFVLITCLHGLARFYYRRENGDGGLGKNRSSSDRQPEKIKAKPCMLGRELKPWLKMSVLFCILYAASDELHQYFVPGRACRLFDVGVDTAGILFGTFLFWLTVRKREVKLKTEIKHRRINKMKCKELLNTLSYKCIQGNPETEVTAVVNDSRKLEPGCMFICIKGAAFDGHRFAAEAAQKGAAVLLVQEPVEVPETVTVIQVEDTRYAMALLSAAWFGYPAQELKTIAVTGTKGKTTTTYMLKALLEKAGYRVGVIGTIEVIIGDRHIAVNNTTPESYDIHRYFREMADAGCDVVVMEASSQGFKLDRTAGIVFDYGLFTNLSPDHIGPNEHKDFEEYLQCKAKLFTQSKKGYANLDDAHFAQIIEQAACPVQTFGLHPDADLCATDIALTRDTDFLGVDFTVHGMAEGKISCGVPGTFNVHNALGAICIALDLGMDIPSINAALRNFAVKGRVQIVPTGYDYTLIIDYAHNAVSLESILNTLREYQPNRLISLFGCGGNRSQLRRFEMGEVSGRLADLTVITSDNPRFEEPQAIIDDILTGIKKTDGAYVSLIDRREAISYAMHHAEPGDIVVLAGKGHETYQEIQGKKYHMSEEEIVQDVLDGKY